MPYEPHYRGHSKENLKRLQQSGKHYLTSEQFRRYVDAATGALGIDLEKLYDIRKIGEELAKGKPLEQVFNELRNDKS